MRCFRFFLLAPAAGAAVSAFGQFTQPVDVLHTFTSVQTSTLFGFAVAEMSDLDGDGALELIISEGFWDEPGSGSPAEGRVVVQSGRTGDRLLDLTAPEGGRLGFSIADAGDIDGDGLADVVAGAPFRNGSAGAVDVFSGADGSRILTVPAPNGGFFGSAVAGVGDVDGDGTPDLLVGAQNEGTAGSNDGRGYVISGADGSVIREYAPDGAGERFGGGAASVGDLNGDGVSEHILGAWGASRAYLYNGATGARFNVFEGPPESERYGQFFVDGLRDVNGDGIRDLYVGDFSFNSSPRGAPGAAYVYSGTSFDLIHQFVGPSAPSGYGPGRGAGDVDGDGLEDLIVGAFSSGEGAINGGRVSIFSGRTGDEIARFTGSAQGAQLGFDCVGVGDVDGDGGQDFALSAASGNVVYIVAGPLPIPPCRDLTGDEQVNSADLAVLLGSWGIGDTGDLNGDGQTGSADLGLLLAGWGECG